MVIFEKWWHKGNKVICVGYYKSWKNLSLRFFQMGQKERMVIAAMTSIFMLEKLLFGIQIMIYSVQ
jgi:hypothetical protein